MATTYDENGLPIEEANPLEEQAPVPDKKAELLKLIDYSSISSVPAGLGTLTTGGHGPIRRSVKPPPMCQG